MTMFVVYFLTIRGLWRKMKKIEYLKEHKLDVILVKNYEIKKFFEDDSDDEDYAPKKPDIGVGKRKNEVQKEL